MRIIIIALIIFSLSCDVKHDDLSRKQNKDSTVIATKENIQYDQQTLLSFLDSVGNCDCSQMQPPLVKSVDSVFRNRETIARTINDEDFNKLKKSRIAGKLDIKTFHSVFKVLPDSDFVKDDSVMVTYVPFDDKKNKSAKFAIVVGSFLWSWENDIYFFDGNTLVSGHRNFHKNGDILSSFIDSDGNTVIYYLENFGGGSGIWQYNFFFYKYLNGQLVPVLNILENGNIRVSSADLRHFWLEAFIVQTVPLKLKFVYNYELKTEPFDWIEIKKDSTEVIFTWDQTRSVYLGQFSDKLNLNQVYSYYIDDVDLYNVCVDHRNLRKIITGRDATKKNAVYFYLNMVKNNLASYKQGY